MACISTALDFVGKLHFQNWFPVNNSTSDHKGTQQEADNLSKRSIRPVPAPWHPKVRAARWSKTHSVFTFSLAWAGGGFAFFCWAVVGAFDGEEQKDGEANEPACTGCSEEAGLLFLERNRTRVRVDMLRVSTGSPPLRGQAMLQGVSAV